MARLKKNEVRCRATVHLQGGVSPGTVVIVDATDPWIAPKISHERGPLVPLDPNWEPPNSAPTAAEPVEETEPVAEAPTLVSPPAATEA